jgi:hypothetical protein
MLGRWFPVICGAVLMCFVGSNALRGQTSSLATEPPAGHPLAEKPRPRKEYRPAATRVIGLAPGEAERRAIIEEKLDQVTDAAHSDIPVGDAIRSTLKSVDIAVRFDLEGIESEGSGTLDDHVTVELAGASVRAILSELMTPRGWTLLVRDNHCLVTTQSSVESSDLPAAVFEVTDLASHPDGTVDASSLLGVIERSIEPDHWLNVGGSWSIEPFVTAKAVLLIVRAPASTHRHIESLLTEMRRSGAAIVPAETLLLPPPNAFPQNDNKGGAIHGNAGGGGLGGGGGGGFF